MFYKAIAGFKTSPSLVCQRVVHFLSSRRLPLPAFGNLAGRFNFLTILRRQCLCFYVLLTEGTRLGFTARSSPLCFPTERLLLQLQRTLNHRLTFPTGDRTISQNPLQLLRMNFFFFLNHLLSSWLHFECSLI